MTALIYATNVSLDGYIEDAHGAFDWSPHDDDVFAAHTALVRSAGTFLYGRRLYEADKVVYSTTMSTVPTATTRLEHHFDPDAVRDLKSAATSDLTIGGANLAGQAMAAGLVDECQLFVWPMVLGGGKPALPTGIQTNLELLDEHRFDNGVMRLRYRIPT